MAAKRVYFFGGGKAEGNCSMKDVLGGKGAGLAEMTNLGVPVPPGFTVSTEACNLYYKQRGAAYDVDLTAEDLMDLCRRFKALVKERLKKEFPQDPQVQLGLARDAVFRSWNNDRAKYYRKANGIPDDIGTAVK